MVFPSPPCNQCSATCCKQDCGHTVAVCLDEDEYNLFPEAVDYDDSLSVMKALPYINGKCLHLGEDARCSIYERRPKACRTFNCVEGHAMYNDGRMCFFLEDHPQVVELIELTVLGK